MPVDPQALGLAESVTDDHPGQLRAMTIGPIGLSSIGGVGQILEEQRPLDSGWATSPFGSSCTAI
jgi:hypothetical protein